MKKTVAVLLALVCVISLCACGGSGGRSDDALAGQYKAVKAEAMGVELTGDDVSGFSITLEKGGKAVFEVEGTKGKGTWVNDDETVTLTVEGTDMTGTYGDGTIKFEGFLEDLIGVSMDITFAKDGASADAE